MRGASLLGLAAALGCGSEATIPGTEAPPLPYARPEYSSLTETGLYAELASGELRSSARVFTPRFTLWSDGASKQRWLELPPSTQIDTSDMNRWSFPVGTRVWKTFARDGVPLETRMIERYGLERDDYWMGSFVWNAEQSDATFVEAGQEDLQGTTHDAPAQEQCPACHNGEPGRLLGFSALQLEDQQLDESSEAPDSEGDVWNLARLAEEQRLSVPPEPDVHYEPPGDTDTATALGYLHANCGHCHNPRGTSWPDTQMVLRLDVPSVSPEETRLFQSVVGQELQYYRAAPGTLRVSPGAPESSALLARMNTRGLKEQMPPLATEAVDEAGLELVSRWIVGLTP
ncbi:MAG: hypothetical protein RL685_4113 [Pseudomonadota bacterium]|jgi:hypothetical protein